MKNLFFLLLGVILLTGCADDENEPTVATRVAVKFKDATITRADAGQWQRGDKIGVYMVSAGAKLIGSNSILNEANNISYEVDADGLQGNFTPSNAEQTIRYPLKESVDFYAYYPYRATPNQYMDVDIRNQEDFAKIDLMTATPKSLTNLNEVVNLGFKHRLSKITINILGEDPDLDMKAEGITVGISNVTTTAKYDLVNNTFNDLKDVATIKCQSSDDCRTFEAIVIPQATSSDIRIIIKAPGVTTEFSLASQLTFETGKDHQYDITYNDKTGTITSLKVVDWMVNDPQIIRYKLGDYYPDPNVTFNADKTVKSGTAPVGMVFWLDTHHSSYKTTDGIISGQKGLIVDMIDNNAKIKWSQNITKTNAILGNNGQRNTLRVINMADFSKELYPVVGWGVERINANKIPGLMWCIPADIQLRKLMSGIHGLNWRIRGSAANNEIIDWGPMTAMPLYMSYANKRKEFESKLVNAGGMQITMAGYWSSTESNEDGYAWACLMFNGYDGISSKTVESGHVRCIAAF